MESYGINKCLNANGELIINESYNGHCANIITLGTINRMLLLVAPNSPEDHAEAERLNERLVYWALAIDGTITGEQSVGIGKQKYMDAQHWAGALVVMRAIKQALNPENMMNPGKMLPPL